MPTKATLIPARLTFLIIFIGVSFFFLLLCLLRLQAPDLLCHRFKAFSAAHRATGFHWFLVLRRRARIRHWDTREIRPALDKESERIGGSRIPEGALMARAEALDGIEVRRVAGKDLRFEVMPVGARGFVPGGILAKSHSATQTHFFESSATCESEKPFCVEAALLISSSKAGHRSRRFPAPNHARSLKYLFAWNGSRPGSCTRARPDPYTTAMFRT